MKLTWKEEYVSHMQTDKQESISNIIDHCNSELYGSQVIFEPLENIWLEWALSSLHDQERESGAGNMNPSDPVHHLP